MIFILELRSALPVPTLTLKYEYLVTSDVCYVGIILVYYHDCAECNTCHMIFSIPERLLNVHTQRWYRLVWVEK